jgi:hypothetical protein
MVLGLNGVQNGPGPFNGFVPTLKDARAAVSKAWRRRLVRGRPKRTPKLK